jgi:hypothetical protein
LDWLSCRCPCSVPHSPRRSVGLSLLVYPRSIACAMLFRSATRSLSLLSLLLAQSARGVQQYIDDQNGDSVTNIVPLYRPIGGANGWNTTVSGCFSCDPSEVPFNDTFSSSQSLDAGAPPRTVTFNFQGNDTPFDEPTEDADRPKASPSRSSDSLRTSIQPKILGSGTPI